MLAVAEHYYHFEGKSPINQQARDLIARAGSGLEARRVEFANLLGKSKLASGCCPRLCER